MNNLSAKNVLTLIFFLVVLIALEPIFGKDIFVKKDAAGMNNGTNWQNAYNYLQDALSASSEGDTIFVASGIYKPDEGNNIIKGDRSATFHLKNGVVLFGGYSATEINNYRRNWIKSKTILSGDLLVNDNNNIVPLEVLRSDNSFHVVSAVSVDSTAELNGFIIESGNANLDHHHSGGGIYVDGGNPYVKNCTFQKNSAIDNGGAVFNNGLVKILFSVFINNNASKGGAVYFEGNSNLSSPLNSEIINSSFFENTAFGEGGAFVNTEASNARIVNSVFVNNTASGIQSKGGAVSSDEMSYAEIINSTFYQNSAGELGGGVSYYAGKNKQLNI